MDVDKSVNILDEKKICVIPVDCNGLAIKLDSYFTELTGIAPPMPAARFGNLKQVLALAGMMDAKIKSTSSDESADHLGMCDSTLSKHDALDDTRSIALALPHLFKQLLIDARSFELG